MYNKPEDYFKNNNTISVSEVIEMLNTLEEYARSSTKSTQVNKDLLAMIESKRRFLMSRLKNNERWTLTK
jgi:hypothetical protein